MKTEQIELAARSYMAGRKHSMSIFERRVIAAHKMACRFGVVVYMVPTPRGIVLDTTRPIVDRGWRVGPSGTVTEIGALSK